LSCPDAAQLRCRVTDLLKTLHNLDRVDAVMGPFARWVHTEQNLTAADTVQVESILAQCGSPLCSTHRHAASRVAVLWRWSAAFPEHSIDFTRLVDLHMPILMQTTPISVQEVYMQCNAPEQLRLASLLVCQQPLRRDLVRQVWAPFITGAPRELNPAPRKPLTKKQVVAKDEDVPNGILPRLPPPQTTTKEDILLFKILDKVMPDYRHWKPLTSEVCTILHDVCLGETIRHAIRLFLLGGYGHATRVAPPSMRLVLMTESVTDLVARVQVLPGDALYIALAEYVNTLSRSNPGVYWALCKHEGWRAHEKRVQRRSDYARACIYSRTPLQFGLLLPICRLPSTRSRDYWRVFRELQVKTKVPWSVITAVIAVVPSLEVMYAAFERQHGAIRIHGATLLELGMTARDERIVRAAFTEPREVPLADVSVGGLALLYVYVHYLWRRSMLQILPMIMDRCDSEPTDHTSDVMVCPTCFSVRSQASGTGYCKSKDGSHFDTHKFLVTCTLCHTAGLKKVNVRTHRVLSLSLNHPVHPKVFAACRVCMCVTAIDTVVGPDEVCRKCYMTARKRLKARRCFCSKPFTSRKKMACTFVAKNPKGLLTMYASCERHKHVLRHSILATHPIGFYLALIEPYKP
jgi:hypothetical protein